MFDGHKPATSKRRSFGCSVKRLNLSSSFRISDTSKISNDPPTVKVVVRVRPESEQEKLGPHHCVVHVPEPTLLVFDPEEESDDFYYHGKKQRDLLKRCSKNKAFCFDHVFDGESTNFNLFEECALPVIDGLLNGFNCSIFAYGATGSGKTHTMLGCPNNPGITFLMVMELFDRIGKLVDKTCDLSISYLEVYNEAIKDLLCPSKNLQIREDIHGVKVSGLSIHKPKDAQHLLNLLEFGNKSRTQHPTDANKESSRSHAIFQIYVRLKGVIPGISENVKFAKMSLVDLAGSERASVIQNHDKFRLREGASINQSLLALGSCINALADKKKSNHVPYRNSKLTRILKDSLGGNCQTVMIAAVSPSSSNYDDTYNTLNYADRAKKIKIVLKRNAINKEVHISKHKKLLEALQKENASLRLKLKSYEDATNIQTSETSCQTMDSSPIPILSNYLLPSPVKCAPPSPQSTSDLIPVFESTPKIETLSQEFKDKIDKLITDQLCIRSDILNCESNSRLLQVKRDWKQVLHNQINSMSMNKDMLIRSSSKLNSILKSSRMKEAQVDKKKSRLESQLAKNQSDISSALSTNRTVEAENYIQLKLLDVEKATMARLVKHMFDVATFQQKEYESTWRLSEQSLNQLRDHQLLLKSHGYLTTNLEANFESLLKQVEGTKEVNWADEIKSDIMPNLLHQIYILPSAEFTLQRSSLIVAQKPKPYSTSTPGVRANNAPLSMYLSPNEQGQHSYIQVESAMLSCGVSPFSSEDEIDHSASPVLPRSKFGSPHPIKMKSKIDETLTVFTPIRRSLEDTFSVAANNSVNVTAPNSMYPQININLNGTFTHASVEINPMDISDSKENHLNTPPSPVLLSAPNFPLPKSLPMDCITPPEQLPAAEHVFRVPVNPSQTLTKQPLSGTQLINRVAPLKKSTSAMFLGHPVPGVKKSNLLSKTNIQEPSVSKNATGVSRMKKLTSAVTFSKVKSQLSKPSPLAKENRPRPAFGGLPPKKNFLSKSRSTSSLAISKKDNTPN